MLFLVILHVKIIFDFKFMDYYVYDYGFLQKIIRYFPFPIDNKHWNKYTPSFLI